MVKYKKKEKPKTLKADKMKKYADEFERAKREYARIHSL